jgi:hypothetical protein
MHRHLFTCTALHSTAEISQTASISSAATATLQSELSLPTLFLPSPSNANLVINRFLLSLTRMNNNQAAGSSKKSRRARFRELLPSFARGRSRASSRATSPIPGKGIADDVPPPGAASASTLEIRPARHPDDGVIASTKAVTPTLTITLDDNLDDSSEGGQDAEQDTPDLARQYDTWKIAEDKLRQDKKKRKLLDAYYEILKSKLNEDLQPAGTSARRNQLCAFIVSESKNLQDPKNSGRVSQVLKQACGFIVASKHVVTAASAPCLPASIACAGMMLICSVSRIANFSDLAPIKPPPD